MTTATAATADHSHDAHATATGVSNEKVAMWTFLGSEAMLFGGLISVYLLYKNRPSGNIADVAGSDIRISQFFNIPFTSATSFVLLASSLTMVLAVTAAKRGESERTRVWLGGTLVLGAIFIGAQIFEFTEFAKEGLGFTSNTSSSAFYTLTGLHGTHVAVGIVMLATLLALSFLGRLPREKAEAVEIIGLYWHFVDIVWVVIFTIVYLIP